jgi:hypothetical protein
MKMMMEKKQPKKNDTIVEDQDKDEGIVKKPERVFLDFVEHGYNWKAHMTAILHEEANNIQTSEITIILPHDLFDTQKGITHQMSEKFNDFLGVKNEEPAISNCLDRIEKLKKI